jgi:hypothetical protein
MERVVVINGRELRAHAITLGELRRLQPVLNGLGERDPFQSVLELIPLIHASLKKAQPELKQEDLEELLTIENFNDVLGAVLEASGLRKSTPGEEPPAIQTA